MGSGASKNDVNAKNLEKGFDYPNPETVPIWECTPVAKDYYGYVKLEDTFWSGKKKLIPDFSAMDTIDKHVIKATGSLKSNPEELVGYVTKTCKTDVEKVRAIIRWIAENIAYDTNDQEEEKVEDILVKQKTDCFGYANVLKFLCKLADLECEVVQGQTKNIKTAKGELEDKGQHRQCAWNRVKINGHWYLADCTWSTGTVDKNIFTKKWNEWWFLTDPEAFIYSHLPVDEKQKVSKEKQMIQDPITTAKKFHTMVEQSPASIVCGIEPISHRQSRIETKENGLNIKYRSKMKLSHYALLTLQDEAMNTSDQLESKWYMLYVDDDEIINIHVRFPKTGVYRLNIMGTVINGDKFVKKSNYLLVYNIIYNGKGCKPFSASGNRDKWGETPNFLAAGFKVLEPDTPVIKDKDGLLKVKVQLPTFGIIPNTYKLVQLDDQISSDELKECVYAEKNGNIATYYIQCPKPGEYRFEINVKYEKDPIKRGYYTGAAFLITTTSAKKIIYKHPSDIRNVLAGPSPHFFQLGLATVKTSLLTFDKNGVSLLIKKTEKPVYISVKLLSIQENNAGALVSKVDKEDACVISIARPTKPGYYWLNVFASDKQSVPRRFAGTFCLPYKVPFHN